jgi:hypothetical protein
MSLWFWKKLMGRLALFLLLIWIEDPKLEGASIETLKSNFRSWVHLTGLPRGSS